MAPPTKRRKRNVVQTSDDEEEGQRQTRFQTNTLNKYLFSSPEKPRPVSSASNPPRDATTSPSPSPAKRPTRQTFKLPTKPPQPQNPNSSSTAKTGSKSKSKSTSTSPEKARARSVPKDKQTEKGKTVDLVTLFSRQADRAPKVPPTKLDDIISDPISMSDDDEVGEHRAALTSRIGQNARKRFREAPQPTGASSVPASQKFLRPSRPTEDHATDDEHRPWSERFGPLNLAELAVHGRKVADVRRWLEDAMTGRMRQRLLILKGAAGTGKTTTVRLLARDMKCEILEWRNPAGSSGAVSGFQSVSAQFEEFMGRGGKFGQLETDLDTPLPPSSTNIKTRDDARKIILIEEFPNTFSRSSTPLTSFRNTVIEFLSQSTPPLATFRRQASQDPIVPVVMIISETLLTTTSASADSFTAHRLLGPDIMRHPGTGIIEFNPVAPTILASALELIVQKEARKSGRKRTPGPLVLKRLGEIGDIRSAISSLEFLCLKGDSDTDWGSKVTFTKPKRGGKNAVALTKGEAESLELMSQRESTLGIFHAVGKVVYNKRDEVQMDTRTPEGQAEVLPSYLASYSRLKRSEVSVDNLIDETGTDTNTFISALHENYALSCETTGPSDPNSSLDYINGCIEYLSESDLLCPSWDIFFGGRGSGSSNSYGCDSASQVLRQDEITFQVATRGLLFSLPNPVKRVKTASGRAGGDSYKLFYPTSLKLWRDKEELEGLVDHWATTLLKGDETGHNVMDGASAFRRPRAANNSSGGDWISKHSSSLQNSSQGARKPAGQDQAAPAPAPAPPLLSLGSSARREMLLERLPYMAHMARRRRNNSQRAREIEKVVSFTGVGGPPADEEAADVDADADNGAAGGSAAEEWATDKPTEEGASPRKRGSRALGIIHCHRRNDEPEEEAAAAAALPSLQDLVLSYDDIEDDDD